MTAIPSPEIATTPVNHKRLMTPRDRFFWWYSGAPFFLGPFGFIVGPLMARRATRKVEQIHPAAAWEARQRDHGFTWWQWWLMTPLTVLGAFWAIAALSTLPMMLLVLYAQLTQ